MKKMSLNREDIHVIAQPLPGSIRAFSRRMKSGRVCIVVNASLDEDGKRKALNHELEHINRNDFDSEAQVHVLESGL